MLEIPRRSTKCNSSSGIIRVELTGSDTCTALGVTAQGATPVLKLCRQLLASGLDPDAALEIYRRGILALRVRNLAEAAGLEINSTGSDFVPCAVRTGLPARVSASPKQIDQVEWLPSPTEAAP